MRWKRLVSIVTLGLIMGSSACGPTADKTQFEDFVRDYDVIIVKHCFPSSEIQADTGNPDPTSQTKTIENYKAIYRLLRSKFEENPNTIFIVWTLPPDHRLSTNSNEAARATQFSQWLKNDFLTEGGAHPNMRVFDFRSIVMDPSTDFLKYDYEKSHTSGDSHPNDAANNVAGPLFAQCIVDSISDFAGNGPEAKAAKIIFLHHSTGGNVYDYPAKGVPAWFRDYNSDNGTDFEITDLWYPTGGQDNMPVDYYDLWLAK